LNYILIVIGITIKSLTTNNIQKPSTDSVVEYAFMLYPNPANETVLIETNNFISGTMMNICDLNGQILTKKSIQNEKTLLDISNLTPGVYFVKLFNDITVSIQKLIKE
jgi:hypothetical protein